MAFKERWLKAIKKGQDMGYAAAHKTGYGIGYATTTVKEEVAYAMHKVTSTKVAQSFANGYHDGRSDAQYAFVQRCIRREEKARERADAKAAMAAANELFDEFEDEDFDF